LDYKVQASVINWQALINLKSDCSLPHLCSAPHLSSQPSGRSRSSSQLDTHSYNLRSRGVSTNLVSEMPGSNTDDSAASSTQASELAAIATALAEVQRQLGAFAKQMSSMSSRIAAVETPPASSALSLPATCPYGLPGYGGIPPTTTPTDDVPPPTTTQLPIHLLPLPHSPSPIPHYPPPTLPSLNTIPHTPTAGVPRFHRLEFALFDGKEDPLQWLNRCEQFFEGQRTLEDEKVWLASYHMTGIARTWYTQLQRDEPSMSWELFKQHCQLRFGPPLRSNPLGELARLPFRTTVDDYQERFWDLLAQTAPLSQEQKVHLFTAGLPERIKIDVELMAPRDTNHALSLARAYERRSQALDHQPTSTTNKTMRQPQRPSVPVPAPQPVIPAAPSTGQQRTFKKLTPAEMAERRRQGLCFNCDEQYVRGHRCPKLFYLQVTDYEEDESIEADSVPGDPTPVISLHALTGIHSESTLQLEVHIMGKALTALLDTGSTHNFINQDTTRALKLDYQPSPALQASVANGDKIMCCKLSNIISFTIGQEDFLMDAYAIPIDSFDISFTLGPREPVPSFLEKGTTDCVERTGIRPEGH
jgi:hypothetical protein